MLCTAIPDISTSSENINTTARVSRLSLRFLWLCHKEILSIFTGIKNGKAWNNTREKHKPVRKRQNLPETDMGSYYNKEKWLEEVLDDKGAFYNDSESADSANNDDT